jgi:hypothetical protein
MVYACFELESQFYVDLKMCSIRTARSQTSAILCLSALIELSLEGLQLCFKKNGDCVF